MAAPTHPQHANTARDIDHISHPDNDLRLSCYKVQVIMVAGHQRRHIYVTNPMCDRPTFSRVVRVSFAAFLSRFVEFHIQLELWTDDAPNTVAGLMDELSSLSPRSSYFLAPKSMYSPDLNSRILVEKCAEILPFVPDALGIAANGDRWQVLDADTCKFHASDHELSQLQALLARQGIALERVLTQQS